MTLSSAFRTYWVGQGLSALGDAMTVIALPLVVFAETGSIAQMGALTAFARGGGLVATALAGFIVDRWDPRRVLIACDVVRSVLMALVPLAWLCGIHGVVLVYAVAVGAAIAQGIHYVGHVSLVAGLVGRAHVGVANSRIEGTLALAYVFGPFAAGLISAELGPRSVLGIDSVTFFVSVLTLVVMGDSARPERDPAPESRASTIGLDGLRFIRSHRELARLTILVAIGQFFTGSIVDLFIYRLKHDLRQSDAGAGVAFALASMVAVLAAVAAPRLRARISFRRIWIAAVLLQGLVLVVTSPSNSFALVLLTAACFMAAWTLLQICQASFRQEVTPEHLLGRVSSSYLFLIALPAPLGALLSTSLAARFGAATVQAGVGAGLVATALLAAVIWVRTPRAETR